LEWFGENFELLKNNSKTGAITAPTPSHLTKILKFCKTCPYKSKVIVLPRSAVIWGNIELLKNSSKTWTGHCGPPLPFDWNFQVLQSMFLEVESDCFDERKHFLSLLEGLEWFRVTFEFLKKICRKPTMSYD
jgi:hypothetical protein